MPVNLEGNNIYGSLNNIDSIFKDSFEKLHGAYGVVVSMFDFHRSDRGSNPGRGGKIS